MDFKDIINAIVKRGANLHVLARALGESTSKIKSVLSLLVQKYSLAVFPAIEAKNLGLNKVALVCKDSKLKLETEKKLFVPVLNLFRADFEENKFINILYYTDNSALEAIHNGVKFLKKRKLVNCEVKEISEVTKYYRDIECYDFSKSSWICEDKNKIITNKIQIAPDEGDVNLITALQLNPSIPYHFHPHYIHVKKVLDGFMYTLGKNDFIIDVISKYDTSNVHPNIIWTAKAEDVFISEIHVNYSELEQTIQKVRRYGEVILAPMSPDYAEGYSIPFEIFRQKKWTFPKILTE